MQKLLYLITIISWTQCTYGDFQDYLVSQTKLQNDIAKYTTPAQSLAASQNVGLSSNNCPPCSSGATSPMSIPPLTVVIQDASNPTNVLCAVTLIPNSSFTVDNAILTVNIFPPSNPLFTQDASFYIVCTLKTLHGTVLQKQILPLPPISLFQSQTNPLIFATLPASISIYSGLANLRPNSLGILSIPADSTPLATSTFLPTAFAGTNKYTAIQQQQFFNIISPLSQQFLIQQRSNGLTATSTLGTMQSANNNTFITLPAPIRTAGRTVQPIAITISDGNNSPILQFTGTSFNEADLRQGLYTTVHIFPPSTTTSGNYFLVATIKTLDGLKFRKQILSNVSFTNIPISASVVYGPRNTLPVLTYNFLDINIASQSMMNMLSPIVLKMMIQQQINGVVTAVML